MPGTKRMEAAKSEVNVSPDAFTTVAQVKNVVGLTILCHQVLITG